MCIEQIGICCAAELGRKEQADILYYNTCQVEVPIKNASKTFFLFFALGINLQKINRMQVKPGQD